MIPPLTTGSTLLRRGSYHLVLHAHVFLCTLEMRKKKKKSFLLSFVFYGLLTEASTKESAPAACSYVRRIYEIRLYSLKFVFGEGQIFSTPYKYNNLTFVYLSQDYIR